MAKTCIKCGYARRDTDNAPDYACPSCGVVYAKAEAAQAQAALAKARASAYAAAQAETIVKPPAAPAPGAPNARADAMIQQLVLAQAGSQRRASPYKGMALVALVAFSVGFASAAGLYSGMAKFARSPLPAAHCAKS